MPKAQTSPSSSRKRQPGTSEEIAIISDIHSNLQALEAVVAECRRRKIDRYFCLGDIVGYGANPVECLKLVRSLHCTTVLGNHDFYVATGTIDGDITPLARRGIEHSSEQLSKSAKKWLNSLPLVLTPDGVTLVHSSLFEPLSWHYLLEAMDAMPSIGLQTTPVCFFGHTHVTKIYVMPDAPKPKSVEEAKFAFPREGRCLVNPGSVGQPRGADPRAHFAVYHPTNLTIEFLKVPYNTAAAAQAILDVGLPAFLAERLLQGR